MDDLGSLWTYQENIDELKHKLLCTTVELDSVKMEAKEQMNKNQEFVKRLLDLLKTAQKERDEAKDQLQKLLNKITVSNPIDKVSNILPRASPESPLLFHANKANSSITESNSLSETYNHHSHNSSPVDSIFDTVSSPEFSNINVADSSHMGFVNQPFVVQDYKASASASASTKIDHASAVIDNLVKGKTLPQKGKLLQAVMEAGPLLQTLLVAGPLPRWRNPPPLQPFKIPPVSIKGAEAAGLHQKPLDNSFSVAQWALNTLAYSQSCSASMLNFGGGSSSSCFNNSRLLSTTSSSFNDQIPIPFGKRQRLH